MDEQAYFTKSEAAHYLRCSPRFIDYARQRNELRGVQLNKRKLLFSRDELDRFARRCSTVAESEAR